MVLDPSHDRLSRLCSMRPAPLATPCMVSLAEMLGFVVGLRPEPADAAAVDGEFAAHGPRSAGDAGARAPRHGAARDRGVRSSQHRRPTRSAGTGRATHGSAREHASSTKGACSGPRSPSRRRSTCLEGTDLHVSRAELHVAAGAMFQEMSEAAPRLMQQAINHYHQAMALVNAETRTGDLCHRQRQPRPRLHHDADDRRRPTSSVSASRCRACARRLSYFTPESHPERWSSTQLNLANALVYMPSKHQADNIAEAVGLYEGVLQHRDRQTRPARSGPCARQPGQRTRPPRHVRRGEGRLHESRAIFEEFDEDEAVRSVRGILDEIAKHESIRRQDRTVNGIDEPQRRRAHRHRRRRMSSFERLRRRVDDARRRASTRSRHRRATPSARAGQEAIEAFHRPALVTIVQAPSATTRAARNCSSSWSTILACGRCSPCTGSSRPTSDDEGEPGAGVGSSVPAVARRRRRLVRIEDGAAFVRLEGAAAAARCLRSRCVKASKRRW